MNVNTAAIKERLLDKVTKREAIATTVIVLLFAVWLAFGGAVAIADSLYIFVSNINW